MQKLFVKVVFLLFLPGFVFGQNYKRSQVRPFTIHPVPVLSFVQKEEIRGIVREVEARWTNRHGFLRLTPDASKTKGLDNENPILFTSEYLYVLWRLGMLKGEVRKYYLGKVRGMIAKLRLEPGLFNRYPGRTQASFDRHFSRDEQIGLVTLDFIFDGELGFSRELYEYGKRHSFRYQNRTWSSPGRHHRGATGKHSSKFELYLTSLRQPAFAEYVTLAAGNGSSYLGQYVFRQALKNTWCGKRRETSGKKLAFLRIEVMYGKDRMSDKAIMKFLREMEKMYGGYSLQKIYKIYYTHPDHPVRRLSAYLGASKINREIGYNEKLTDVRLELVAKDLEDFVNGALPQELFRRSGMRVRKRTHLQLIVHRNGRIRVQGFPNKLVISLPLRFEARVDWVTGKWVKIRHHEDTKGALTLHMNLLVSVQNGRRILSSQLNFHWNEKPYIKLGPIRIRISGICGSVLQRQLRKLTDKLNRILKEKVNFLE